MTENHLAKIIYSIIQTKFSDPEYFYSQLKANINRKLKSLSIEYLTEIELHNKGVKVASNMIAYFNIITTQKIELRISKEIVKNKNITTEELNTYSHKLAKEIVKELLNARYKIMRSENNTKK